MKNIIVFFGGASPEHEVSIITGLQILENIDRHLYNPIPVFVSEKGQFFKLNDIGNRKDFSLRNKTGITFGFDEKEKKPYISTGFFSKVYIYCAINTLHGGNGESGPIAGLLDSYNIPYTSTNVESSAICMNKALAKKQVEDSIPVIPGQSFLSKEIKKSIKDIAINLTEKIGLPIIVKPVHLGSSIGIKIAKTTTELELYMLEASHLDTEILAEKYISDISEFNCSVRTLDRNVETSAIERPMTKTEILSFSDKYQRGGKKTSGGMASLSRELPANISDVLEKKIKDFSTHIYKACKCKGVVRIDFIQDKEGKIYFNEINPIPGSMAFYLWEVLGIPFKQQISELIEESVHDKELGESVNFVHKTDIIEKFIKNQKN